MTSIVANGLGEKAGSPDGSKKRRPDRPPLPSELALAYTVGDAVKVSCLSRSSIYNLIGEGKLRSTVVAGRRLIVAASLRQLLQGAA